MSYGKLRTRWLQVNGDWPNWKRWSLKRKRQRLDTENEETELQGMRECQRLRQQDRQRVLSLMQH